VQISFQELKIRAQLPLTFFFFFSLSIIRYPIYLLHPNFYAEDGTVFFNGAITRGFFGIFDSFNGYPIIGVRLIANIVNVVSLFPLCHNLEASALINSLFSIGIWSLFGFMTVLVLRKYIGFAWGFFAGLLVVLTPISGWNYAILGVLGNLKFGFFYFGFLLLLDRWSDTEWGLRNKILFLLCFFTNPISIILLIFFIFDFKSLRFFFRKSDLIYIMSLGFMAILVFKNAQKFPLPNDYKFGSWNAKKLSEVLLGRDYFFPFFSNEYHMFSYNLIFVASILILITLFFVKGHSRILSIFGFTLSTIVSVALMLARGGLSSFFTGFNDPGPAQFFYPQNMIVIVSAIIAISQFSLFYRVKSSKLALFQSIILIAYVGLNFQGIGFLGHGTNGNWQISQGGLNSNISKACSLHSSDLVSVPILPGSPWALEMSRKQICK